MKPVWCRVSGGFRFAARVVAWAGLVVCLSSGVVSASSVWELTPYRVRLIVGMARIAGLTPQLQAELESELAGRVDAVIGAAWDLAIVPTPPALRYAITSDIETVTIEMLPKESLESDKVILLGVSRRPAGYQVSARELDVRTQTFGAAVSLPVWQSAKLRDVAFRAMREAFAPLGRIDRIEKEKKLVVLRLRASGLPSRDETLDWIGPGDVFQPIVRYNDREGNARRISPVPWTFLAVKEAKSRDVECVLCSGLRSPLSGRRRGRVERLALAVVPSARPTRLVLQSRTAPKEPLAGYEVFAHPPASKSTERIGRTDRQGAVLVPPAGDPLRILVVRSGGRSLARLPLVPGLMPRLTAEIPNDDQRLEAEGFITGLQENLVDLVTRREVLIARARARLEAGKFGEADTLIDELRALGARQQFARKLDAQQKRIFSEEPAVQRKIDALFGDTRKLVAKYLDPEPVDRLSRELTKARSGKSDSGP